MLSYEQIGAAAMLSRACAGTIRRTAVFSLPGIREGRPPGDGEADPAGARARRARAQAIELARDPATAIHRETIPLGDADVAIRDSTPLHERP